MRKIPVDNKTLLEPEMDMKIKFGDNKEYKIKAIINSAIYSQQTNSNQMLSLYYLILQKSYLEEKNTWEPLSVVIYL